ncbi:hypothetical protein JCM8547_001839 [Rhodosporidiobolus lusitaniae]
MALSRLGWYGAVSTSLFTWTVVNAFRQRSNFYAAAVYLSKSNACMMILWNQGIFQTILLGKVLQAIFLGELRLIEIERLQERGWFAVTETLLALTIFREDFESSFVMLFVSLLFFKVFHWLASDRVEMMEQTARVTRLAHARMIGLLSLLWLSDILLLVFAVDSILMDGPTVMIMFASEYMILLANVWSASAKYILNVIDMRREEPWEQKSIYVFYVELAADFFKLVTYLAFFGLILTFYGLPLNILRDVYITTRSFILKIRDLRRYRQATRNMDTLYPNATREEMEQMADKTCIICREDMEYRPAPGEPGEGETGAGEGDAEGQAPVWQPQQPRGPNDTPKKLPCNHVFHFHCLRSWLERQQSCPTCRRPVLPQEQPPPPPAGQQQPAARAAPAAPGAPGAPRQAADVGEEAIRQAQVNLARNLGREAFAVIFPGLPFPAEADAGGPAARLPPPPVAGGPTLAPPPVPPHHEQDPHAVSLPPSPAPATPAAGPSTPAPASSAAQPPPSPTSPPIFPSPAAPPTSTSPRPATAVGNGLDNPLARFSLPNLPAPSTGEAGLYHSPPSFAYPSSSPSSQTPGFSDLAYGAYPQFAHRGPAGGLPPPPAGTPQAAAAAGLENIEQKIKAFREKWLSREAREGTAGGVTEPASAGESAEAGPSSGVNGTNREAKETVEKADEGDVPAVEVSGPKEEEGKKGENEADDSAADSILSPREAALRAAELRARKGKGKAVDSGSSSSAIKATGVDDHRPALPRDESNETVVSPLPPSTPDVEQGAPSSSLPAATQPTTFSSSSHSSAVPHVPITSHPRLIPLFDPSNPSSAASLSLSYPSLFPSSSSSSPPLSSTLPLFSPSSSAAASSAQLSDLDRLTRQAVEERIRLLASFQDRIEGLVKEMRGAVGEVGVSVLAGKGEKGADGEATKEGEKADGEAPVGQEASQ